MRTTFQMRLPNWQNKVFRAFCKKHEMSYSSICRFAFNYLILNHNGKITQELADQTEFRFRKKYDVRK